MQDLNSAGDCETSGAPEPGIVARGGRGRLRWPVLGAGVLLLLLLLGVAAWLILLKPRGSAPYAIETDSGSRRMVALEGGASATLNGATRVVFDSNDHRLARLERGEVLFAVPRVQGGDTFRVLAGKLSIESKAARFAVVRENGRIGIAVDKGPLMIRRGDRLLGLASGQWLETSDEGRGPMRPLAIRPSSVAAWRDGRLVYHGQPLRVVAADLARYYGMPVKAAAPIAEHPCNSDVELYPDGNVARMGARLRVRVERDAGVWMLAPIG